MLTDEKLRSVQKSGSQVKNIANVSYFFARNM